MVPTQSILTTSSPFQVPNSLPNRSNIEIEIYGMEGIPAEDVREHERLKNGNKSESEDDEPTPKKQKTAEGLAGVAGAPPAGLMMNMMQQFGGMPPHMMGAVPGFMGPGGMQMMQPHMMGGPPPRPLFPAAATSMPSVSMLQQQQQQAKPTFPAYSNATISAPPTTNTVAATNPSSKIMHPADDLSLEELRARKPKYRKHGAGSSNNTPCAQVPEPSSRSYAAPPSSSPAASTYSSSSSSAATTSQAPTQQSMTGAAVAQAAILAQQQVPTSMADQQNAALFAQAMAQNQKQFDDLNRAVMMQRFQQAAAAGARPQPGLGMVSTVRYDDEKLSIC